MSTKIIKLFILLVVGILANASFEPNPGEIIYKIRAEYLSPAKTLSIKSATSSSAQGIKGYLPAFSFPIKSEKSYGTASNAGLMQASAESASQPIELQGIGKITLQSTADMEAALSWLKSRPEIEYVHYNYRSSAFGTVPNDPYYNNVYTSGKTSMKDIYSIYNMEQAWDISTGSETVTVAVIDTGVQYDHPDLIGKVIKGHNYIANNNFPYDDNGHGTHVAGIIAASSNNAIGVAGMAWNVKIYAIKVLDSTGHGNGVDDLSLAIAEAVITGGAKVINLSLGFEGYIEGMLESYISYYSTKALIVVAAGNENSNLDYHPISPVCNDGNNNNVLGVANIRNDYIKKDSSNYSSKYVDLSAVGTDILSTVAGSGYAYMTGTSMATPMVAGLAALLFSYNSKLTVEEAKYYLMNYSTNIDGANPSYRGMLGRGVINGYRSLRTMQVVSVDRSVIFYNYPNPITNSITKYNYTNFFVASEFIPQNIVITVYTFSGVKLKTIRKQPINKLNIADWDLRDENYNALPPGIYLAILEMTDSQGALKKAVQKVVIR